MPNAPADRPSFLKILPLLLAFGLVPLLWFKPGYQLASEDMDIFFDATHWWAWWGIWNPQLNAGVNYNVALAAQWFHTIPAFLQWLGTSFLTIQKIQWVLWFTLQGFGIAYLMVVIVRPAHWIAATAVAVSFYLFNLYQETVWLSMDIAKLSASIVLPFLLAECLRLWEGALSFRRAAVTILLASLFGSGIGVNPPIVFIVVGALALALLTRLAIRRAWRPDRWEETMRAIRRTAGIGILALAAHAFWIFPLLQQMQQDVPTNGQTVSASWLDGISADTSFANVCRFRGDWTWYQGWKEPYRPYAATYQHHWGFIALGWCLPLLVLFGVLYGKGRYKLLFILLTGLGLALSMGTHPPMGALYRWLTTHIPWFWTFRSPWHKFTLWTCLGYAVFLGMATSQLCACVTWRTPHEDRVGHPLLRWFPAAVLSGLLITANLVYAFPVTVGRMYTTAEQRQFLPPNHVQIPPYVWETSRWLDRQQAQGFFRVLVLPESESWTYQWGLGTHSPVLLSVGLSPVLFPMGVLGVAPEQPLVRTFYKGLYGGASGTLVELLRMLNVRYLLHETDLEYWVPAGDTDAPPFIRAALARQTGITRGPTFGAWELSEVQDPRPPVYYVPAATLVVGDVRALLPLTQTAAGLPPALVLTATTPAATVSRLLAAHAVDQVVLTPDTPLPAALPATLPVTLVASTLQLTRQVAAAQARPLMPTATGFRPPDAAGWQALESNSAPNWVLTNPIGAPQPWQVEGTVVSPRAPRSLYAYVDGQLVKITAVPADIQTHVVVDLTLAPGMHTLAWYSPDARTVNPDGTQVGFRFAADWRAGPPAWVGTFQVPRSGPYRVQLLPGTPDGARSWPTLILDHRQVPLANDPEISNGQMGQTILTQGLSVVELTGVGTTPYAVILAPVDQPHTAPRRLTPLPERQRTPTTFRFSAPPGPGWVIVSEAYHPGWALTGAPGTLHVPVNGFANGYYVVTPPSGPMTVMFTPQRWVWVGGVISLITVGGGLLWGMLVGRTRGN